MPEKMIRCQFHLSYSVLFEKKLSLAMETNFLFKKPSKQQTGIFTTVRSFAFRVYKTHSIENKQIKEKNSFLTHRTVQNIFQFGYKEILKSIYTKNSNSRYPS